MLAFEKVENRAGRGTGTISGGCKNGLCRVVASFSRAGHRPFRVSFDCLRSRFQGICAGSGARAAHGRAYDDTLLRERIPYMYLVPARTDGPTLHAQLQQRWGFQILATAPVPRASLAQLTPRVVVARRP